MQKCDMWIVCFLLFIEPMLIAYDEKVARNAQLARAHKHIYYTHKPN